jgi:cobalt-zinc-cadmium efflux system outer membrane protein
MDPLDVTSKRLSRVRSPRVARTIAEAQFQDAIRNQIDSLYATFVDVQAAQERVHRGSKGLFPWWQSIRATNRGTNGSGERNEFRSSLIAYQVARRTFLEQDAELGRTRRALALTLDLPQADADRLEVEEIRPMPRDISLDSLLRMALDARPDLAALRLGFARAHRDLESSRKLSAQGSDVYILHQPYTFGMGHSSSLLNAGNSYALGVATRPPDSPRDQATMTRANVNLTQTQVQLDAAERQIRGDVERCHREWTSTLRELPLLKSELDAAVMSREVVSRSFEAGKAGVQDVIAALRDHDELERRYVNLLVAYRRSTLALNTSVGQRILP